MKYCEEIKNFLEGKEIKIEKEENSDFEDGNYLAQSKEDTISLIDGYIIYILNKEETKCYISISRRIFEDDVNDEFLDDGFFEGYFSNETLTNLLNLL